MSEGRPIPSAAPDDSPPTTVVSAEENHHTSKSAHGSEVSVTPVCRLSDELPGGAWASSRTLGCDFVCARSVGRVTAGKIRLSDLLRASDRWFSQRFALGFGVAGHQVAERVEYI